MGEAESASEGKRRAFRRLAPAWSAPMVLAVALAGCDSGPSKDAVDAARDVGVIETELHDFRRFRRPRQLMAYLGLIPSESSSGDRTQRGGITKTGNRHVRRLLVE